MSGSLLSWFTDYLSSRRQRVVINGISSPWDKVLSGVPQGSVLGPILFILFINDLPDCLSFSRIAMFADDTKCYNIIRSQDDITHLQHDLQCISNWALHNELSFQPVKCENLRISRKRNSIDRSYFLNGVKLKTVDASRDLGIFVSKDLHWATHINSIIAKANKMLGFLRRNCYRHLPLDTQRTLYICLVRSHLTYACQVWSPISSGSLYLMRNLERVQRRATRLITQNPELSYKSRLRCLKLLPLCYFYEYLDLLFLFRCLKGEISINIFQFVNFSTSTTRRGSSGLDLRLLSVRSSTFRDSFFVRICPVWNSLPINIRSSCSTSAFKLRLKRLYLDRLDSTFDVENIRSWRIICPLCRRSNLLSPCTC